MSALDVCNHMLMLIDVNPALFQHIVNVFQCRVWSHLDKLGLHFHWMEKRKKNPSPLMDKMEKAIYNMGALIDDLEDFKNGEDYHDRRLRVALIKARKVRKALVALMGPKTN